MPSRTAKKEIIKAVADVKKQFGLAKARKYCRLIQTALQSIARNPYIGRSYGDMYPDLRGYHLKWPVQRIIFYQNPAQDSVRIIRFLHDSMDLDDFHKIFLVQS